MDELFHHYFLSSWATRSYRLHFEPTDCYAGKLARERTGPTPPAVLNLNGVGAAELCAGSGQFLAASMERGSMPILASDSDSACRWLLKTRFKGTRLRVEGALEHTDFAAIPLAKRELVKVLYAGFPCVAYSRAGMQLGSHDPRAWVGYWAIEETFHLFPNLTSVVLEITLVENGYMFALMTASLEALDMVVSSFQVVGTEHGDSQARVRLIVLAEKRDLFEALGPPEPPSNTMGRTQTARDVLGPAAEVPEEDIIKGKFPSAVGPDRGPLYPLRQGRLPGLVPSGGRKGPPLLGQRHTDSGKPKRGYLGRPAEPETWEIEHTV